jgi:hypothetical protein
MTALWLLLACAGAPGSSSASPGAEGCTPSATPPPAVSGSRRVTTKQGAYIVEWTTDPQPVVSGELFSVRVTLRDAATGAPVEDGTVQVDARMPQHGHGMATRPEDDRGTCDAAGACRHPGGVYVTRGMKFHMPGEWTLTFQVEGPRGRDHADARTTL